MVDKYDSEHDNDSQKQKDTLFFDSKHPIIEAQAEHNQQTQYSHHYGEKKKIIIREDSFFDLYYRTGI